ncbi:glycogen debranching protein GlgX [Bremerella sp. P1]|uniref:glycogen debranching protein GlgX n=1 Tax=Bremerella sp. P1 TaxID=3026424 RepID=UPI0023688310|nr:glycogen debranching protein GlgX [Bremerella sp. P1]WDI40757.1 glycogen debranching protein GlgX [Bremerella sp. P1]
MLMVHPHPELQFSHVLPYGAILHERGVRFVVFSRSATAMRLLLYKNVDDREPSEIIDFDRETDRWGDIWSIFIPGLSAGQLYHFQAEGPYNPDEGMLFDGRARLIDPYAKALAGTFQSADDGIIRPPKCVVVDESFNWEGDRHLKRDLSESIIYEMHVKGFTAHESSDVEHPGTYRGVVEKIPYLKSLGVTAVELMPIHEFPIMDMVTGKTPTRGNYWGYDSMAFFAPHRGYAASKTPGGQVREFKEMVKALHQAGIEVILDVVYNHTCEGNEKGPILSFKGLENQVYYMLANGGREYKNYSGCGNTVNGNHPIVREMIFNSLRHWVHNYHVDGFRFDLASILSRDRTGNLVANPPLVEAIAEDPMLADTKIIAEAWDAAGAYQVGSFANLRWAEWNGRYRDDIRSFWKGEPHKLGALATRLAGSSDLYQAGGRQPYHSINFITSHDGFPMNDLVSYNHKHNEANGEGNRDGDNHNLSYNYGVEGPTKRTSIEKIRRQQIKNMFCTLLLSQGVPMILMGDEVRRTQHGNNNAYCQDNEISWLDWSLVKKNDEMRRFVRALVAFRRDQPTVRQKHFLGGYPTGRRGLYDVNWYNNLGTAVDWDSGDSMLTCLLASPNKDNDPENIGRDVLLMMNGSASPQQFILPPVAKGTSWRMFVDTAATSPSDVYPDLNGPRPPAAGKFVMPERSVRIYVASR